MSAEDPKRLSEAGSPDLRALLDAGKSEGPDAAQMAALAAKIGAIGAIGGGGAAAAGGAAAVKTATKVSIAVKIASAVAIVGATSTAVVVATQREAPKPAATGLVATASPTAMATATASALATATASASASASASAPAPAVPRPAPSADTSPEAEVKLLEQAQDALRDRPAQALALCNDHAKRFPKGMLVQEREVIAIEALVKTGRKAEAKARAARFEAAFPGSSHTRRVETLVAD